MWLMMAKSARSNIDGIKEVDARIRLRIFFFNFYKDSFILLHHSCSLPSTLGTQKHSALLVGTHKQHKHPNGIASRAK